MSYAHSVGHGRCADLVAETACRRTRATETLVGVVRFPLSVKTQRVSSFSFEHVLSPGSSISHENLDGGPEQHELMRSGSMPVKGIWVARNEFAALGHWLGCLYGDMGRVTRT